MALIEKNVLDSFPPFLSIPLDLHRSIELLSATHFANGFNFIHHKGTEPFDSHPVFLVHCSTTCKQYNRERRKKPIQPTSNVNHPTTTLWESGITNLAAIGARGATFQLVRSKNTNCILFVFGRQCDWGKKGLKGPRGAQRIIESPPLGIVRAASKHWQHRQCSTSYQVPLNCLNFNFENADVISMRTFVTWGHMQGTIRL